MRRPVKINRGYPMPRPGGGPLGVHEAGGGALRLAGVADDGADSVSLGRCSRTTVHGWRS
jgi:hypothetical protein